MTVEAPSMEKNVINKLKGNFAVLDLSPGGAVSYFFNNNGTGGPQIVRFHLVRDYYSSP